MQEPPLPRGPVLFPAGTPPAYRRRRIAFAVLALATAAAILWPVYSWFSAPFPQILGLPLSFAWIVLWLLVSFAGLVALYRGDRRDEPADPER